MRRLSRKDGLPALRGMLGDLEGAAFLTGFGERERLLDDELRLLWLECDERLDDR